MEGLTAWIRQIVLVLVLIGLAELLLPRGGLRKYADAALGLLVMVVVLNPLVGWLGGDLTAAVSEELDLLPGTGAFPRPGGSPGVGSGAGGVPGGWPAAPGPGEGGDPPPPGFPLPGAGADAPGLGPGTGHIPPFPGPGAGSGAGPGAGGSAGPSGGGAGPAGVHRARTVEVMAAMVEREISRLAMTVEGVAAARARAHLEDPEEAGPPSIGGVEVWLWIAADSGGGDGARPGAPPRASSEPGPRAGDGATPEPGPPSREAGGGSPSAGTGGGPGGAGAGSGRGDRAGSGTGDGSGGGGVAPVAAVQPVIIGGGGGHGRGADTSTSTSGAGVPREGAPPVPSAAAPEPGAPGPGGAPEQEWRRGAPGPPGERVVQLLTAHFSLNPERIQLYWRPWHGEGGGENR